MTDSFGLIAGGVVALLIVLIAIELARPGATRSGGSWADDLTTGLSPGSSPPPMALTESVAATKRKQAPTSDPRPAGRQAPQESPTPTTTSDRRSPRESARAAPASTKAGASRPAAPRGARPKVEKPARRPATGPRSVGARAAETRPSPSPPSPSEDRDDPQQDIPMRSVGPIHPPALGAPTPIEPPSLTPVEARAVYLAAHARLIEAQWAHKSHSASNPSALASDSHPVRVELSAASAAVHQARSALASISQAELNSADNQIRKQARTLPTTPPGIDPELWEQEAGWRDFRRNWGWQNRKR